MPTLNVTFAGTGTDQNGNSVAIPSNHALVSAGPRIQATITLLKPMAATLLQTGKKVPQSVSGYALIDTGASSTCIDDAIAQKMGLPVVDTVQMSSASHKTTTQNVYPVSIELAGLPMSIDAPRAVGAALSSQGIIALIGRDVLQHCTLFYNGTTGQISLSI